MRSPRELGLMRKAGLAVWGAHQAAKALVRPGITTAEIDAVIDEYFARYHAVPLFKGVPGKVPFPAATCTSVNDEVVHGIPGARRLNAGDIVSLDTGCKLNGWCGDSAYTHPVGAVSADVQRLLDVTKGVLDLAIELMAVKTRWSDVAREMGTYVRDNGFSVVENFVGHGIGRDMHEEPQVPNFVTAQLRRSHDFNLEPGLVIAVEPMVNMGTKKTKTLPDHWTQVTADGRYSAHFEHTVAMTGDGPWVLTAPPQPGEEFDDTVLRDLLGRVPQTTG
ncbi:MAG TPA: type I methionyl aminopeptidase [Pirellulales bacterium]